MDFAMKPVLELQAALWSGKTTSRELVERALARIADPEGEGGRTFLAVHREAALDAADASDRLRGRGVVPSPLAGLPVSLKDLIDEQGQRTRAASRALDDAPPAVRDAAVAARLRAAGAILVGRTNMTEFAFSGLGLNRHFDTPRNVWDRAAGRIPGGSSSGAAVSVADGMAVVGVGTDTGGSVRIPAALNGVTGFKTTTGRIPLDGVYPLAKSLDSVGPLAPTVACCVVAEAVMSGRPPVVPKALPVEGLRLGVPRHYVLDGLDDHVSACFDAALRRLSDAGARIADMDSRVFAEVPEAMPHGGLLGAEALALHAEQMRDKKEFYDQRVWDRIWNCRHLTAAGLVECLGRRADITARADELSLPFDALLMPTCPTVAPVLEVLDADPKAYARANALMLRNTTVGNFLDRCALSIPCHPPGTGPVGLMVMAATGHDDWLARVGLAVERALAGGGR